MGGSHPNRTFQPKRSLTGFLLFAKEMREAIKNGQAPSPPMQVGQVMKLVGAQWQAMPRDQKAVYEA